MAGKYLIVVDMQMDFVFGSLGSKEAQAIISNVIDKVKNFEGTVIFTKDTHGKNYLQTQEGKNLPVEHCIKNTHGWELIGELDEICKKEGFSVYQKGTFGCTELAEDLRTVSESELIDEIELMGVCTDICVVSNTLLLKAYLPEVLITVDSRCCAGTTKEKHEAALETLKSCQINII